MRIQFGTGGSSYSGINIFNVGEWVKIDLAYDLATTTITTYVNGVDTGVPYNVAGLDASIGPFRLGRAPSAGWWNGRMDELKIYNRSLTASEISELYNRSVNKYYDVKLREGWDLLGSNLPYLDNQNLWMWADFECSYTNWHYFNPYISFRGCCEDCECSEDLI